MVMEPEPMYSVIVPAYPVKRILARFGWHFGRILGWLAPAGAGWRGCVRRRQGLGAAAAVAAAADVSAGVRGWGANSFAPAEGAGIWPGGWRRAPGRYGRLERLMGNTAWPGQGFFSGGLAGDRYPARRGSGLRPSLVCCICPVDRPICRAAGSARGASSVIGRARPVVHYSTPGCAAPE